MGRKKLLGVSCAAAILGWLAASAWLASSETPADVPVRLLWMERERWEGRKVRTAGVLKRFLQGQPRDHFVLEDEGFRVGVRGEPKERLERLQGRRLEVEGRFFFDRDFGIYVTPERIQAGPAPSAPGS